MRTKRVRRIIYAVLAVLLWMGFVVDGIHALYTDQVTLTGNSITSGTANLLISNSQNGNSTLFEKTRVGFDFDLTPGESGEKYFFIKNASTSNITFGLSLAAEIQGQIPILTQFLSLTFTPVDSDGQVTGNPTTVQLSQLVNSQKPLPFTVPKGVASRFKLTTSLSPDFANQGESVTYDLIFNGIQVL